MEKVDSDGGWRPDLTGPVSAILKNLYTYYEGNRGGMQVFYARAYHNYIYL